MSCYIRSVKRCDVIEHKLSTFRTRRILWIFGNNLRYRVSMINTRVGALMLQYTFRTLRAAEEYLSTYPHQ